MVEFYNKNKENINKIITFLIFTISIYLLFKYVAGYFAPFIFGYILAIPLYPLANILNKKLKIPKSLASILSIIFLLALFGSIGVGIITKIIMEAKAFYSDIPNYTMAVIDLIENLHSTFNNFIDHLPIIIKSHINNNYNNIISFLTSLVGNGVKNSSVIVVKKVPNIVMVVIFGFISCFFIIKDKPEIDNFIFRQFPDGIQKRLFAIKNGMINAITGYLKAQGILMSIVAIICFISLLILGSPYALFLAVIIAIIDALPVFGSGAIFWPWVIYSILNGDYTRAIHLAITNIIVLITRQLLEPKILGNQIGLHPLITLTAIYFGLKVFGILGIIFGPMLVLILKAMQDSDLLPKWK